MDMNDTQFVQKLHKLVFPYSGPVEGSNEDCMKIQRELKLNLCVREMTAVMAVIARAMDMELSEDDEASNICNRLYQRLNKLCYAPVGFKAPVRLNYNFRNFLKESGLNRMVPNATDLAVKDGISTRDIMTPLFAIYIKTNPDTKHPDGSHFLKSNDLMDKWFGGKGNTYSRLQDRNTTGEPFSPNKFRYANLQSIITDNVTNLDSAPNPQVVQRLDAAQEEASNYLQHLRENKGHKTQVMGSNYHPGSLSPRPGTPSMMELPPVPKSPRVIRF